MTYTFNTLNFDVTALCVENSDKAVDDNSQMHSKPREPKCI